MEDEPIDAVALKHSKLYSNARDGKEISSRQPPCIVVRADKKRAGRLNVVGDLIYRLACPETDKHLAPPGPNIVFSFNAAHADRLRLAQ